MTTRFYLPASGAPTITPAFHSGWEITVQADRIKGWRAPQNTTETNTVRSETDTGVVDVCARQYILGPFGVHTYGGTVKGQIGVGENNLNRDCRAQQIFRVVDSDGSTEVGVLLGFDNDGLDDPTGSEFTTGTVNRPFPRDGAVALSTVAAPEGHYLALEVGYRAHNLFATQTDVTFRFGDEHSDTDLPEDSTTSGTNRRPWIEFSQNIPMAATDSYEQTIRDVAAGGPFSYYPLDETSGSTLADKFHAYNMTITGAPILNQTGPFTGWKAVSFDGVDDYSTAQVEDYSGSGTTIGWAKTDNLTQAHGKGWLSTAQQAATTEGQHTFEVDDNGGGDKWQFHYLNGASNPVDLEGAAAVADVWIFWAATAGPAGLKFYLAVNDVISQQGATDAGTDLLTYQQFRLCTDKDAGQFGDWQVSRVAVWHSELSQAQLQTIYDAATGISGGGSDNDSNRMSGTGAIRQSPRRH